jgi:hypothetical protein
MNTKDAIRGTADLSSMVLKSYVGDLSDADLLERPAPGCNHLAWQLGHLISSESDLLEGIQPGAAPRLPEGFAAKHSKETTGVDDPAKFCTKQEYLDLMDKVRAATFTALEKVSDSDLDQPSPEQFRQMVPTVGHIYLMIATHQMMHAGQFVAVRRKLGKPVVI